MAKSVTRYDEVGNAVIREARPASSVRTAPRNVKAKGAVAVAEWNKANKPQPGKTGEQAMQIVERQIYKRAADMRAKKTIASTARSFSGGQLLEALSANNGPKVAPDAPVTQKRAAIASGMAARAANRTEAGGSDGGPKRRAADRFARVARGEKPFGGAAVARNDRDLGRAGGVADKLKGLSKEQLRQVERDVGVIRKARPNASAKSIAEAIEKHRVWARYQVDAGAMAAASGDGWTTTGKPDPTVGTKEDARFSKALDEAVGKARASAPVAATANRAAASRAGKAKPGRVAGMSADNPFPSSMTKGSRTGTAADTARSPSFIDKVNAAQAASDAARKNAPKPPATPPGPRDHWNRIGADGPSLKDVVRPGPGQPVGTLTEQQKLALVKSHGMGGAMVASQMPTHPSRGVTNDSAMGMASTGDPKSKSFLRYLGKRADQTAAENNAKARSALLSNVNTGLAVVGTGVAAAQAFNKAKQEGKSTGEAMGAGALAATPGALMLGAQPIGNALSKAGSAAMSGGMGLAAEGMGITGLLTDFVVVKMGMAAAGAGAAMKVAGEGLKIAGKVAAPAMAAWGAYQGAKEDDNKLRGAARGALRSLDPSAIVTGIGAGTGLMKDGRGLGERAYDAAFGGPTQGRLSSTQAQTFARADTNYDHMGMLAPPPPKDNRGWSPESRIAAAQARGAVNLPYGGDPTQAPGYTPPKDRRPY